MCKRLIKTFDRRPCKLTPPARAAHHPKQVTRVNPPARTLALDHPQSPNAIAPSPALDRPRCSTAAPAADPECAGPATAAWLTPSPRETRMAQLRLPRFAG